MIHDLRTAGKARTLPSVILRGRLALLAGTNLVLLSIVGAASLAFGISRSSHARTETAALVNTERAAQLRAAYTDM